jgi:Glucodextranase, domain B
VVVTVVSLVFATAASATNFLASDITTPADGTFATHDFDAPATLHVEGTTTGGDSNADLVCFYGTTKIVLAPGVTVTGNAFVADVSLAPLANPAPRPYCVLRAVPAGDTTDYPPDMASPPFRGPHLGTSALKTFKVGGSGINKNLVFDYLVATAQPKGYMDYDSLGGCGVDFSFVFDPITLAQSNNLYYCNGWIWNRNGCATPNADPLCVTATRSDLKVDDRHAYLPAGSASVYNDGTHDSELLTGFPLLSVSKFIDPLNGDAHMSESNQVAVCSPNPVHHDYNSPAWATDCSSFAPAGVKIDRTGVSDNQGRRGTFVDVWSSTDGAAHQVDVLYDEEFRGDAGTIPSPSFDYSWDGAGFIGPLPNDTVPGPSSDVPVTALVDGNGATPDTFMFPQGAVTFSMAPTAVHWWRGGTDRAYGDFRFVFTVPRNGSVTIAHSYLQGQTKTEISDQIAAEQARIGRPHVAITNPLDATTVGDPAITITGTASDPAGGLTGLTVNGDAVGVAGDGSWSKAMTLSLGENTITATGTDTNGNTTTVINKVTYTPPSPAGEGGTTNPPPPPQGATADKVAPVLGLTVARTRLAALLRRGLAVTAKCSEACSYTIALLLGKKTIGRKSGRLTAPGSKKVTVKLSKKAAKQLRKARRVKLTVKLTAKDAAGNLATKSKRVTVRR